MFDKESIETIQASVGIAQAAGAIGSALLDTGEAVIALPETFSLHDLEAYLPHRRRARGVMTTSVVSDFGEYVTAHGDPGATVFVDASDMKAVAVLNLGTRSEPGHADDLAVMRPEKTAAYEALQAATSSERSQQFIAEFLEDWSSDITCFDSNGQSIAIASAIAAVRRITIKALRDVESTEEQLSATRGVLEQVSATSKEPIPAVIRFGCNPYVGFYMREFDMRLSILTGGDKPTIRLRIVKQGEHQEAMARELADRVKDALTSTSAQLVLGTYAAKKG